jgi:hypothetical protein
MGAAVLILSGVGLMRIGIDIRLTAGRRARNETGGGHRHENGKKLFHESPFKFGADRPVRRKTLGSDECRRGRIGVFQTSVFLVS